MEAWRRLHGEYYTTSSMRRAASSEPSSIPTCRRLGNCSGRVALKETPIRNVHRQERTSLPGIRQPCGGDVPVDAKELRGDRGFQELFDRLLAYSSTKQSIRMARKALLAKERAAKARTARATSCAGTVASYEKDCRQKWSQDKCRTETGAGGDEHADGRTWRGEQAEGWWKANGWQSSGQWMSANDETAWEPEEPVGGFEINGTERCDSKSPRWGKEQRVWRWQRPSVKTREEGARDQEATHSSSATAKMSAQTKERHTVISTTPTEQRVMVPPEIPHDTRICIEDLGFEESDSDELREEREMQDECRRWNAQTRSSAVTWVKKASKLLKRDVQGLRMESEEDPVGEVLISGNTCVSKWTASKAPWNMRRRSLLLRRTSLMLTMSARGPTLMERRCTMNHRRRVDGKRMSTTRWIFQPQTQRFRPMETGSKLSRSLKTRMIARTVAMGVKRKTRGAQCHAPPEPRRPRRQGLTSTGIVLSRQHDLPCFRRDNRGSKLLWPATLCQDARPQAKKGVKNSHLCLSLMIRSSQDVFSTPQLRNSGSTNFCFNCRVSPRCISMKFFVAEGAVGGSLLCLIIPVRQVLPQSL